MDIDEVYRQGFLRAVDMVRQAIKKNQALGDLDRIKINEVLDILAKRAQEKMLSVMQ